MHGSLAFATIEPRAKVRPIPVSLFCRLVDYIPILFYQPIDFKLMRLSFCNSILSFHLVWQNRGQIIVFNVILSICFYVFCILVYIIDRRLVGLDNRHRRRVYCFALVNQMLQLRYLGFLCESFDLVSCNGFHCRLSSRRKINLSFQLSHRRCHRASCNIVLPLIFIFDGSLPRYEFFIGLLIDNEGILIIQRDYSPLRSSLSLNLLNLLYRLSNMDVYPVADLWGLVLQSLSVF